MSNSTDNLPELTLSNLSKMDHGTVGRRFNDAVIECIGNISRYPFRDAGKVEVRKIIVEVTLTPEIRTFKQGVEVSGRQQEVDAYELSGVKAQVKIKSSLPDAICGTVKTLCKIVNNQIRKISFNPHNNQSPEQMELDMELDEAEEGR